MSVPRFTIDTEFYERPNTIELISIALVAEDGREYYAESALFDWRVCDPTGPFNPDETRTWLWENVRPSIGPWEKRKVPTQIAEEVLDFIAGAFPKGASITTPEFWGYYSDYDWVVFCWMFGRMIDLPKRFPMYCLDLKQVMHLNRLDKSTLGVPHEGEHNCLNDARWNMKVLQLLTDEGYINHR